MDPEILKFKVTKVQQISVLKRTGLKNYEQFEELENWFEIFAPTMN